MRFTVKKYVLQGAVERAAQIAPVSAVTPVLEYLHLNADERGLTCTGSDGEITLLSHTAQVEVSRNGQAVAPSKLVEIVRSAPDGPVVIDAGPAVLTVEASGARWELRLEAAQYPQYDPGALAGVCAASLSKETLLAAFRRVHPAISAESVRPAFQFVDIRGGFARACDGSRLHQVPFEAPFDVSLGARAVAESIRCARRCAVDSVGIGQTESHIVLRFDDDLLVCSKHIIEYPDVDSYLLGPARLNAEPLVCDRKVLLEAVHRVALVADEETSYLALEAAGDTLTLTAFDKFQNRAREALECTWPYEPKKIGVNYRQLADMLGALTDAQCVIHTGGPTAHLRVNEAQFEGVLVQLRGDFAEAARPSQRTRAQRLGPVGWREPAGRQSGANNGTPALAADLPVDIDELMATVGVDPEEDVR